MGTTTAVAISGTGLYTPPASIDNRELVASFNAYAHEYNETHREQIDGGDIDALQESSESFIVKASGIRSRFVVDREGVLDPRRMCPDIPERTNDELSVQAEMAVAAARQALDAAGRDSADVDAVLVACSNMQRPYPAMAIEVQNALGIDGFGFDMNVACSSATFGIQTAADMIRSGSATRVLMVNPEICSGHLDFRDRDSHFIFGDVCTAAVLESVDAAQSGFEVLGTRLKTVFSNNIRNNFGFLNRGAPDGIGGRDKLFVQEGRRVFKEVVPMVSAMILAHLDDMKLTAGDLKRLWLHQANLNMNQLIARKVLGHDPAPGVAPVVLDRYANTSSAGSMIAFHSHNADLAAGDLGLICSFGAGYSAGTVMVKKLGGSYPFR